MNMEAASAKGPAGIGDDLEAKPALAPRALPTWFGGAEESQRPLFGWYHAPALATARACGVVLCNPFGYEMMCSHRAYRHLAERLAAAGFPVLRFDYDGTGDSAGDGEDPNRVSAWLASIEAAIAELKGRSGVRAVSLFGLRLGGLLATAYAAKKPVDSLILFGPARSGRTYLREMRAFQMLKDARTEGESGPAQREGAAKPEAKADPDAENAVVGFPLDAATRADLEAIDLTKLKARPASRALVIARDDIANNEDRLVKQLADNGVEATLSKTAGYAAMMTDDPYKSAVPSDVWDEIVAFLARVHPSGTSIDGATITDVRSDARIATHSGAVHEELVEFDGMFGVVSEPAPADVVSSPAAVKARGRTAIILLNIGANHRVGSNNMYVGMARAWAAHGFRAVRFDLSGIGDSPAKDGARENDVYSKRGVPEAQAAIEMMKKRGCDRFVLAGLCSGAYVAYHAGVADPRVSGVIMINPLTFHWHEGDSLEVRTRKTFKSTRYYSKAFLDAATWKRAIAGDVAVMPVLTELAGRVAARGRGAVLSTLAKVVRPDMEPSDVARGFRSIVKRGADVILVFGADDGGIDVMEEHLGVGGRKLRGTKGFRLEILEGPDHTFTPRWTQKLLREILTAHVVDKYGST